MPRDEVGIGEAVGGLLLSDFGVDVTCFTRAAEAMIAVHDLDPLGTWRPTRPAHS